MITTRTAARVASLPLCLLLAACGGSADRGAARDTAAPAPAASAAAPAAPAAPAADSTGGQATAEGAPLDPNTATREQLAAVPGMTAAAADALVAGRPYADMVAVNRVLAAQVSDTAARKTIYARVWKPVDLNTAKAEEILLIPGVGRRMLHEFEEYRPYRDMARFRREIGKYVDSAEVARLERYVTIR
jgi:DNA uptake protein ComE-like DNA-binding protein